MALSASFWSVDTMGLLSIERGITFFFFFLLNLTLSCMRNWYLYSKFSFLFHVKQINLSVSELAFPFSGQRGESGIFRENRTSSSSHNLRSWCRQRVIELLVPLRLSTRGERTPLFGSRQLPQQGSQAVHFFFPSGISPRYRRDICSIHRVRCWQSCGLRITALGYLC